MKKKLGLLTKLFMGMNAMALAMVIQTANSACLWIYHQPEFPEEAGKYNRIKND